MKTKICTICKIEKNESDFHKKSSQKGTLRGYCKECQSQKFKKYYQDTRDNRLKTKKQYVQKTRNSLEHIKMRLIDQSKKRAKKSGIEHTITAKDLHTTEYCPVLGIKLASNAGGIPLANSYSLDRVENSRGYTPDNVKIISYRANSIKSDGTYEEHIKVAKYINSKKNPIQKFIDAVKAFFLLVI